MSINFTKSNGHFGEFDLDYVNISTDGITLEELEDSFQRFLKACGYIVDDMAKPQEWGSDEDIEKECKKMRLNEIGLIEEED